MYFLEDAYDSEIVEDLYAMESADVKLSKELLKLNTLDQLYEIDCIEKDMQFAMESVDDSEYLEYFAEAAKELDVKKENILKRAWEALKELVSKVKAAFRKLTRKKVKPDSNIAVDATEASAITNIKKEWLKLKPVLLSAKTEIKKHKAAVGFVSLLAIYGVSRKVIKKHNKKVTVKGKQLNDAVDTVEDVVETVEKVVDRSSSTSSVSPDVETANINFMQEILRTTQQFNNQIQNTMHEAMTQLNNDLQATADSAINASREAVQQSLMAHQMAMQTHVDGVNAAAMGIGMSPFM